MIYRRQLISVSFDIYSMAITKQSNSPIHLLSPLWGFFPVQIYNSKYTMKVKLCLQVKALILY